MSMQGIGVICNYTNTGMNICKIIFSWANSLGKTVSGNAARKCPQKKMKLDLSKD